MLQSIFVSAHPAGNCQLILGEHSAILIDCSVSFCASETVQNIKNTLGTRPLNAIILSHSHYDHVTGLPWVHKAFPDVPVFAHPYVKEVFSKPGALATIRHMCHNAQVLYGDQFSGGDYNDSQLQISDVLYDGQPLPFDNDFLRIIFTPGHTKDAISVDFSAEKITWICETIGVFRPDGRVQPCFLSGYQNTLDSIRRIKSLGERQFTLSHTSEILSFQQSADFLTMAQKAVMQSAGLIVRLFEEGRDFDGIFEGYAEQYWNELYRPVWPHKAFSINTTAAIKTALRELCGQG